MTEPGELTDRDKRLLKLVDELRKRGVLQVKLESADLVLEASLTPLPEPERLLTEEQRNLLMNSPDTPETMKEKLRVEYERDLYASA